MSSTEINKLGISICFIAIAFLGLVTRIGDAGYHISFYTRLPAIFWLGIVMIYSAILYFSYSAIQQRRRYLKVYFILIALLSIIFYSLPYVLGDFIYGRSDVLSHLGMIQIIIETNRIPGANIYPATHTTSAIVALLLDVNYNVSAQISNTIFPLIFLMGSYSVLKIQRKSKYGILGVLIIGIPIYTKSGIYYTPFNLSVFSIPLLIWVWYGNHSGNRSIIMRLLISIFMIYLHPLTAVFFFITVGFYELLILKNSGSGPWLTLFSVSIINYLWLESIKSPGIFSIRIAHSLRDLLLSTADGYYSEAQVVTSSISPSLIDLTRASMFRYGTFLFAGILFCFCIKWTLLSEFKNHQRLFNNRVDEFLIVGSIICVCFAVSSLFTELAGANFQRFLRYFLLLCMLFVGRAYSNLEYKSRRRIATILIVFILLLGAFSAYNSPATNLRSSQQVTDSQINTFSWVFTNKDDGSVESIYLSPDRFCDLLQCQKASESSDSYIIRSSVADQSYEEHYNSYPSYFTISYSKYQEIDSQFSKNKIYDTEATNVYQTT